MTGAEKFGRAVGRLAGQALLVGYGYLWANHGIVYALEIYAIGLGVAFAIYGVTAYPWKEEKA